MRHFLLLLIALILGHGCAAKRLTARNADVLLELQIEKRLPLYYAQKTLLKKDVDRFLNEQKLYTKEAVSIISSIALDINQVDVQYNQLSALYQKLALNFSKLMSKYMAQLDDKQQKEFEITVKRENQTLELSKSDKRLEMAHDRFETVFGTISDKQKEILQKDEKYFEERHKFKLNRRQKLQAKFSEIYRMDISLQSRSQYFYEAFSDYLHNYPEADKDKEIIKRIIPTLSKSQKDAFEDRTNDLKDIINYYLEVHY